MAERETPAEAATAILEALEYLEREARLAGCAELADTITDAIDAAADTVVRLRA